MAKVMIRNHEYKRHKNTVYKLVFCTNVGLVLHCGVLEHDHQLDDDHPLAQRPIQCQATKV